MHKTKIRGLTSKHFKVSVVCSSGNSKFCCQTLDVLPTHNNDRPLCKCVTVYNLLVFVSVTARLSEVRQNCKFSCFSLVLFLEIHIYDI